ncbi:hypothetical protein LY632_11255 [Erythrobacter sp. SDW2]|uniref:hypothetical protein n=1 Tax=Erythrobacter sp. SDW2 TaxID=2907154 RepID=UPI001F46ED44|nr:hypothetical protein [Erythrobacter sp. SDW2]UIP06261.1 hypothetical protein LY632_11255 [Erythrobacter sp. SDW2]
MPAPMPTTTSVPAPSPTFPSPPIMQSPVAPAPAPVTTNSPDTARRYVSNPQVQDTPEPSPAATAEVDAPAAQPTTTAAANTTPVAARSAVVPTRTPASPVASTPVVPTEESNPIEESLGRETSPPIAEYDPTLPLPTDNTAVQTNELENAGESGFVGLLAAALADLIPIGLAVAAVVWWRRRSRPVAAAPQPTVVSRSQPSKPAIEPEPARAPLFTRDNAPRPVMSPAIDPRPSMALGGGVALVERATSQARTEPRYDEPEVPSDDVQNPAPENTSARSRMIERMVDAEPDDANPFRTRKARRRRARLLLASRESGFGAMTPAYG